MNQRSGSQSDDRTGGLRNRKLLLAVVGVAALVALAGCSSLAGLADSGPSVSDAEVVMSEDDQPTLRFDYSVDDYSKVVVEGPSGYVLNSWEVSPEKNQSQTHLLEPRAGEYTVALQQGGETKVEESLNFEGPSPEVTDVQAKWSGNTVESVQVTVQNTGDLPAGVDNVSYSARGDVVENVEMNKWIEANETTTLEASTSYGSTVSIEEPGDVRGDVAVNTLNGTLSGEFSKSFEGANLTVSSINDLWDGNTMETVEVRVENTGDLPTTANVSAGRNGDMLGPSRNQTLSPGVSKKFELGGFFLNVDTANTAGETEFTAVVDSPDGHVTETFTHEIEGANVTLNSMTPVWEDGELTTVRFSASNSGELDAEFSTEIAVNGQTVKTDSGYLDASSTEEFELSTGILEDSFYSVDDGGEYEVTLTLSGQADWSDSASATTEFKGESSTIRSPDPYFTDNYDETTADLNSLSFTLQNTGDVLLQYDSVEIEINGVTGTDSTIGSSLDPGESTTEYTYPDLTVSEGTHEMTIRVLDGGETVAETTTTVTAGDGEK